MPLRPEWRQVLLREPKQAHGRARPFAMLRMSRMLEMFLQMHERARGLDQPLEILSILRRDRLPQPDLLQDVMRLVITLLVPAPEKGPVIGMRRDALPRRRGFVRGQRFDKT